MSGYVVGWAVFWVLLCVLWKVVDLESELSFFLPCRSLPCRCPFLCPCSSQLYCLCRILAVSRSCLLHSPVKLEPSTPSNHSLFSTPLLFSFYHLPLLLLLVFASALPSVLAPAVRVEVGSAPLTAFARLAQTPPPLISSALTASHSFHDGSESSSNCRRI